MAPTLKSTANLVKCMTSNWGSISTTVLRTAPPAGSDMNEKTLREDANTARWL